VSIITKFAKACTIVVFAATGTQAWADPEAEMKAIIAVDQTWEKAYNGRDADTIAGLYDKNAVLLPPGTPAVKGRAAIKAFFARTSQRQRRTVSCSSSALTLRAASPVTWDGPPAPTSRRTSPATYSTPAVPFRLQEEGRQVALSSGHMELRRAASARSAGERGAREEVAAAAPGADKRSVQ
jgi:SnoaL-like protein